MKTEAFIAELDRAHAGRRRALLACASVLAAWAAILITYRETVSGMAAIWTRSETFAHGWVVLPLALWLAWRGRKEIAWGAARPWWVGGAVIVAGGAAWLVGVVAAALAVQQVAVVVMVQGAAIAVLGPTVSRQLAFPLALLLFAAPVGEFLVPTLIDRTADFTVMALRATGIPVYREGSFFIIPSGSWSVVEGCSGIRYIVASLMAGLVYAHLAYRTRLRKAVFVAAAVIVPIVANWLRAYLIVLVGHLSDNRLAAGIDHIVYGWLFFGVVMALMFAFGAAWREPAGDEPPSRPAGTRAPWLDPRAWRTHGAAFGAAAAAAFALAVLWPVAADALAADPFVAAPTLRPVAAQPGWRAHAAPRSEWRPHYSGHRALAHAVYARGAGEVTLFMPYYRGQVQGRELVNSQNVVVHPSDPRWRAASRTRTTLPWRGGERTVNLTEVSGPDGRWLVADFYRVGTHATSSEYVAALYVLLARLTGSGDDAAAVLLYAPFAEAPREAAELLAGFTADHGAAIDRALDEARSP